MASKDTEVDSFHYLHISDNAGSVKQSVKKFPLLLNIPLISRHWHSECSAYQCGKPLCGVACYLRLNLATCTAVMETIHLICQESLCSLKCCQVVALTATTGNIKEPLHYKLHATVQQLLLISLHRTFRQTGIFRLDGESINMSGQGQGTYLLSKLRKYEKLRHLWVMLISYSRWGYDWHGSHRCIWDVLLLSFFLPFDSDLSMAMSSCRKLVWEHLNILQEEVHCNTCKWKKLNGTVSVVQVAVRTCGARGCWWNGIVVIICYLGPSFCHLIWRKSNVEFWEDLTNSKLCKISSFQQCPHCSCSRGSSA